jgi:murein DD-endopeptidase MepM/ murein hydrolase activator NlpD
MATLRLLCHAALAASLWWALSSGGTSQAAVAPGHWVWPLEPRPALINGYAPPAQPWLPGHRGVDLAARPGQLVLSAGTGRVSFAGRVAGRGVVVVDHGALRTTYQPVRATVRVGANVAAGSVLGRMEVFGSHCFPHVCLHWGLLRGDRYVDPLTLVGGGRVRLLPLAGAILPLNEGIVLPSGGAPGWRRPPTPGGMPMVSGPSQRPLPVPFVGNLSHFWVTPDGVLSQPLEAARLRGPPPFVGQHR